MAKYILWMAPTKLVRIMSWQRRGIDGITNTVEQGAIKIQFVLNIDPISFEIGSSSGLIFIRS